MHRGRCYERTCRNLPRSQSGSNQSRGGHEPCLILGGYDGDMLVCTLAKAGSSTLLRCPPIVACPTLRVQYIAGVVVEEMPPELVLGGYLKYTVETYDCGVHGGDFLRVWSCMPDWKAIVIWLLLM